MYIHVCEPVPLRRAQAIYKRGRKAQCGAVVEQKQLLHFLGGGGKGQGYQRDMS